jgi:hypothetical protein
MTLANMTQLINGTHAGLPNTAKTNMKPFDFVGINNYFDGCHN